MEQQPDPTAAEQSDNTPVKRAPTPASWKPGHSGNPRGRPRSGFALAEAIREGLDPQKIVELVQRYAADDKIPLERRLAVLLPWLHAGYLRPPTTNVNIDASAPALVDYSQMPTDELRAEIERRRALQSRVIDTTAIEAKSESSGAEPFGADT